MTGEHVYAIQDSDTDSKQQDKEALFEQFSDKDLGDYKSSPSQNSNASPEGGAINGAKFCVKEKEGCLQREAVIRPRQTGKIDFKSLQNRPKFSSDRSWPSGKSSPQSPTGKSKGRDKNKRSGKGDRNPQQLYKLSMTSSRSNPTIGIAYPQQKVTPPKKLENIRGPITGSYRFHVPSIPEREAELQQEDLNYNRCFQEASSNLTSTNYTSQAPDAAHQQHPSQQQANNLSRENTPTRGQLHYPEFQNNGSSSWHSTEKTFGGANYGLSSSQKPAHFPDANKATFGPLPFQYGFSPLQDATSDPFPSDHSQDYVDVSLANNQVTHSDFAFSSSGDGQEESIINGQYDNLQPDRRTYTQPSQQAPFIQPSHGTQSICYKGKTDHSAEMDSAVSTSCPVEQSHNTFPENQAIQEMNLHNSGASTASVNKRSSTPKDNVSSQRIMTQGNPLTRNLAQGSLPQMHFQGKTYGSSPVTSTPGLVPFDKNIPNTRKNHPRLSQPWDGANKTFPSIDKNAAPYCTPTDSQFQFQCQPAVEQQQRMAKNGRLPWQQIHLTSAMPNQNRIELSRQLSNQKLPFPLAASEWQEENKSHKNTSPSNLSSFHGKKQSEDFINPRNEGTKQNCSPATTFLLENGVDTNPQMCNSRNKSMFYGLNQSMTSAPSRMNNHLPLPPGSLITPSPYESPLHSPVQNPSSSSTCSSLSPVSSSPINASSEDSQLPMAGPPPPFYHQHCHLKEGKSFPAPDQINPSLHHLHPDGSRAFPHPTERTKDDLLNYLNDSKFSKQNVDNGKVCLNGFGVEHLPPPPYSAQLLANSLTSANLDQLDVLLTCKQCDQNYGNLSSFLEHRQYCGLHAISQGEFKETARMEESRQFQMDTAKTTQTTPAFPLSRCSSDLHLSLLGLSKNGELLLDSDAKGDPRDDPLKLNLFNGMTAPISLTTSDLDIDDAKLDSLITEALNGLGYQSDNVEIDSSFIDAFADDDLSTTKTMGSGQTKIKDSMLFESKKKHLALEERQTSQSKTFFGFERDNMNIDSKNLVEDSEKKHKEFKKEEKDNLSHKKTGGHFFDKSSEKMERIKLGRRPNSANVQESVKETRALCSKNYSERNGLKSYQDSPNIARGSLSEVSAVSTSSVTHRFGVKENKKRKASSGTWSKELIHKIVQQKNKLHKLHVKGSKNLPFSLVMERLAPAPQNSKLGEYDYISDSDEETEPLKISARSRLGSGLSGRPKYSYTKEYKGRGGRAKEKEITWKHDAKDRGLESKSAEALSPPQMKENFGRRVRRRSSRSSTSSDLSTPASFSSESINSPKSTDRTDSDNEKGSPEKISSTSEVTHPESFEQEVFKRVSNVSKEYCTTDFSKNTKRYGSAKFLFAGRKSHHHQRSMFLHSSYRMEESLSELSAIKTYSINKAQESFDSKGILMPDPILSSESCAMTTDVSEKTDNALNSVNFNSTVRKVVASYKGPVADYCNDESAIKSSQTSETIPDVNTDIADCKKNTMEGVLAVGKSEFESNSRDFHDSSAVERSDVSPFLEIMDLGAKESSNQYDCDVYSKPLPVASSDADDIYVCPSDLHNDSIQKDHSKQCTVSYPVDNEQSLVKSPLTFDTSSMFGELSVPEFDNSLYTDVSKDSYDTFNSNHTDKRAVFERTYPPFLEHKDWNIMDEVSPMLSEDISHFPHLSVDKVLNKAEKSILPRQMPLGLPDKMVDYNAPFVSNTSDDELEIKRIVTELENQLQTSKLKSGISEQLTSNSKFPTLHLHQEPESEKDMLLTGIIRGTTADRRLQEHYDDHDHPWLCTFQFGSLDAQPCLHTPEHEEPSSVDHFYSKKDEAENTDITVKKSVTPEEKEKGNTTAIASPLPDKSEEILENQKYAENLMKSLEVISDSIFSKGALSDDQEESQFLNKKYKGESNSTVPTQDETEVSSQTKSVQSKAGDLESECVMHKTLLFPFGDPDCSNNGDVALSPKTTTHQSSIMNPEYDTKEFQFEPVSDHKAELDQSKPPLTAQQTDSETSKTEIVKEKTKGNDHLATEISCTHEKDNCIDSTVNPLQQLQLFVARNIKHNEEEMIMPSYPVLLSTTPFSIARDQSEQKEDNLKYSPSTETSNVPKDKLKDTNYLNEKEQSDKGVFKEENVTALTEKEEPHHSDQMLKPEMSESSGHEFQNATQPQHSTDEQCKNNISTPGAAAEHSDMLSPCSTTTKALLELGSQILVKPEHGDGEKQALTFREHDTLESCDTLTDDPVSKQNTDLTDCQERNDQLEQLKSTTYSTPHQCAEEESKEQAERNAVEAHNNPSTSMNHNDLYDQCNSHKMWHNFDRLSPISMDNAHSPRQDDILSTNSVVLPHSDESISSGLSYSCVDLSHISIDEPKKESLTIDCEESILCKSPLVNILEPSDLLNNGEDTFKETHAFLDQPSGPNRDLPYEIKQSPLNYTSLEVYSGMAGPSNDCKDNQVFYGESIENNYDHSEVSLPLPLTCKESLKPDSHIHDRSSSDSCDSHVDIQANLCFSAVPVQSIKCACTEVLCSHDKENNITSITNAILDFQSMSHGITNVWHPPLAAIEYIDLRSDHLKKSDSVVLGLSLKSPQTEKEKVSLNQEALDNSETLQPVEKCIDCSSGTESSRQSDQLPQIEEITKPIKIEEKDIVGKTESKNESNVPKKNGSKLCDICSASFRSNPGLKRHKAMKHNVNKGEAIKQEKALENIPSRQLQADQQAVLKVETDVSPTITADDKCIMENNVQLHELEKGQNYIFLQSDQQVSSPRADMESCNRVSSEANSPPFGISEKEMSTAVDEDDGGTTVEINETNKGKMLGPKGKQKLLNPHVKSKRDGKTLKSRKVDNNNDIMNFELKGKMADHFSEDILTILKSDILQAITPNFPGILRDKNKTDPPLQEPEEKPTSINAGQLEVKDNNVFSYQLKHDEELMTLSPGKIDLDLPVQMGCLTEKEDQVSKPHIKGVELEDVAEKGTEENRMSFVYEGEDERNMKGMCEKKAIIPEVLHTEILGDSVEENYTKSSCIPESTEWVGKPPDPYKALSSSVSKPQSDLQSLFDDENTFSQLFPRDDQMIRKKCTRVYSKRNKKQKPTPELFINEHISVRLTPPDNKQDADNFVNNNFVSKRNDHCKYETISTNDTLMLEMCHKSTLRIDKVVSNFENATLTSEGETDRESECLNDSHSIMEFLCPNNQAENKPALPAVMWAGAKDPVTDISADTLPSLESSKDFKSDDLAIPCNQDSSDPLDSLVSVVRNPDNPSQLHTIDIQNLNTKFQLPAIHFFDSTRDTPAYASISNNDTVSLNMKASRRLEEMKLKNRCDISKKSKDRQYKCKVCFKWFQTLWELNFHKPSHNPSPPPTCYMCVQRKFSSREQLRDHLKEKHAKNKAGIWTCGMCLKEISNVWMYNEHLREHAIQFARKGQAQQSVLGMPGCFMEQTAVKHFLSSIMQRRPSKSKNNEASTKSPSNKDTTAVKENVELDLKIKEENDACVKSKLNPSFVGKLSTNTSTVAMQKSEHVQKNVTMHPNCKDPSRDCHHCGKQFPKPFKLQRHLVVHSLKKMYLCHKCPIFYQDLQELKTHVKEEHQDTEEPEIKHTTLYACELCADVMHVIKKSFICSTCNYTFSKKEQYDRHMEKHLAEGSKTFKFRGVMRPCKPFKGVGFELQATIADTIGCIPPRKKRKISPDSLIETSSDGGIASVASLHFNHSIKPHISKEPLPVTSDFFSVAIDNPPDLQDMTIKTEDNVDDLSEYLAEMEKSQFNTVPEAPCLLPSVSNAQTGDPPSPELCTEEVDIQSAPCLSTSQKYVDDVHYEQHTQSQSNVDDIVSSKRCQVGCGSSELRNPKETVEKTQPSANDSHYNESSKEETEWSESIKSVSETIELQSESLVLDESSKALNVIKQDGTSQCIAEDILKASEANAKQIGELQTLLIGAQQKSESEKKDSKTSDNQNFCQAKEKASLKLSDNTKQSFDCTKPAEVIQKHSTEFSGSDETGLNGIKHIAAIVGKGEEKESLQSSPKLHQKKRKEYKTSLGSKLSTTTREHMDSDVKKKKLRVQSPLKNESTGSSRKTDIVNDPPVLSSARDDMTSNKLHVKPKIGGINNIQPKKNSFDSYPPKKVDMRQSNWDFKSKKGIFGKPLHSSLSKGPSPFVYSSLNKHRTVPGVKSPEPHSYRTAESQNHLLSQLFGQKLTSFKIPLRKDTSE
ncbi:zinc finger protein 469-like [Polyodon spathula]|uniref:zinc finger protein 469-like n=1 Tax=Polyodon spathula TaxID=7913 RepID=UPI001B7DCB15|nr:zinc finger protein 469-like [Polyodon spathula]